MTALRSEQSNKGDEMTHPNTIKIDNIEYVRADSVPSGPPTEIQIVILQRGWVAVGRFSQDGEDCTLTNASTIRRWGTKEGLGELACKGPLANTILDKVGTLRFHVLTIVARMDVEASKWSV